MNQNYDIEISVYARTDTGMKRPANEDAFMVADLTTGRTGLVPEVTTHRIGERGSLLIVSDGLGGAAAGEIASEMAVKTILEKLIESPPGPDACKALADAIQTANRRIWDYAKQNPEHAGLGATSTAVLVQGPSAYIAQVGDSRAYLARGNRIKQLTKDQSYAQLLVDSGAITPEQADSVPKNIIMQALGTSPTVKAAMTVATLSRGDVLILCSDGLSNKVTPDEIRRAADESDSLSTACRGLVDMANERGGEDNITIVAARFHGESLNSAADGSAITGAFWAVEGASYGEDLVKSATDYASRLDADSRGAMRTGVFSAPSISAEPLEAEDGEDFDDDDPGSSSGILFKLFAGVLLLLLAAGAYLAYRYLSR